MGNSIVWVCDKCKYVNFSSNKDLCIQCFKNGITEKPNELAQSHYLNFIKHEPFLNQHIDKEFPPTNFSLYINGNRIARKTLIHSSGFKQVKVWLRAQNINCGKDDQKYPITLFNNPTPKDVIQGELGTCWFLSALSLVSEKPILLLNLMLTKQFNPDGLHQIRLCRRGEWKIISIDDYLPCDKHNQLVFSYGRKRQFWVPFMEKALAKMYGSYENIAKGACAEGLQTLTGEPCDVIYLRLSNTKLESGVNSLYISNPYGDSKTHIWSKIIQSKNAGCLMTTLCFNESITDNNFDKIGLLNRHIYSILDVREFSDTVNISKPFKLLKLRNPWGHKEWKGKWSNKWPDWPPDLKMQIAGVYKKDDGCFWISFEDVLNYFYDVTICKVRPEWLESRQSSCFYDYSNGIEVFLITIEQNGIYEFEIELFSTGTITQPFDRNADPTADLCLVICTINGNCAEYLKCLSFEHSVEYYITTAVNLQQGQYIVFATSIKAISPSYSASGLPTDETSPKDYSTYNLVFHGQCTFSVSRHRFSDEHVADIFYSVAKMQNNFKNELNGLVRSYVIHGSCTHAILIENLSYDLWIMAHMDVHNSTNLESTRSAVETFNCIRPRSREILTFLTPKNYRNGYVIGYKLDINGISNDLISQYSTYPLIIPNYKGLHSVRNI